MLSPLLSILIGVALLYGGAEGLVRGSVGVAVRLGLTPLVIGLTVVAFGTSMPEMVVSIGAALDGRAPIAVGNAVGSNIANIALILGICALIRPLAVQAQVVRLDVPIMIAVSVVLLIMLYNDSIGRIEGMLLLSGLIAYILFTLWISKREGPVVKEEFAEGIPAAPTAVVLDLALIVGGLALLVLGARSLVNGGTSLAQGFGVSDAVIGLTIVAIGTSLPELATSVLATMRGESDIAVGNAVGSNIFNILGILGVTAIIRPLAGTAMSSLDLTVMTGLAIVLLPFARSGFHLNRLEGSILIIVYIAYIVMLTTR